jgi:hypothetical protein
MSRGRFVGEWIITHPYCLLYGLLPTSLLPVTMLAALHTGLPPDILTSWSGVLCVTILIALSSEVPFATHVV